MLLQSWNRIVVFLLVASIYAFSANADEDKKRPSRETVDNFMKAMAAEDIEAVMRIVDVPWFHDGKKIIESKDELKQAFQQVFEKKDFANFKHEIKKESTYMAEVENLSAKDRELLKKMAKPSDVIFQLTVDNGERKDNIRMLVRVTDGKGKLIGIRD